MPLPSFDYSTVFDGLSVPCAIIDRDLRYVSVNRAYVTILMQKAADLHGRFLFDVFPETPERENLIRDAFAQALAGEESSLKEVCYTIPDPVHGADATVEIWWNVYCTPISTRGGEIDAFCLRVEDVTEVVHTRRMKDAIARELQHRVSNLFATVAIIARRSAPDHETTAAFLPAFLDRIHVLAETNALLTGSDWNGLTLDAMLRRQMASFSEERDHQVTFTGPDLHLRPSDAQILSMAVHELATNAAKYGALSHADGRLSIDWTVTPAGGYVLDWQESGLSDVTPPTRQGFGTILLNRILPLQLDGRVQQVFEATRHHFRLSVDMPRPV